MLVSIHGKLIHDVEEIKIIIGGSRFLLSENVIDELVVRKTYGEDRNICIEPCNGNSIRLS